MVKNPAPAPLPAAPQPARPSLPRCRAPRARARGGGALRQLPSHPGARCGREGDAVAAARQERGAGAGGPGGGPAAAAPGRPQRSLLLQRRRRGSYHCQMAEASLLPAIIHTASRTEARKPCECPVRESQLPLGPHQPPDDHRGGVSLVLESAKTWRGSTCRPPAAAAAAARW